MKSLILFCVFSWVAFSQWPYANWMQDLNESSKEKPITHLMIPATHDSAASQIDLEDSIDMENADTMNAFLNPALQGELSSYILDAMTLTQENGIMQQLLQGIRGFDFRIFYHPVQKKFYMSHSFATVEMEAVLYLLRQYLLQHPAEVLFVQMSIDKEHIGLTTPHISEVISITRSILGPLLIPVTADKILHQNMTLKNLIALDQRILLSFHDDLGEQHGDVWPFNITKHYWPNEATPLKSMAVIETYAEDLSVAQNHTLNLVFFTCTPNNESVIETLMSSTVACTLPACGNERALCHCQIRGSVLDLAKELEPLALDFIRNHSLPGLNLVSLDNPSDEFVEQIIRRN